MEIRVPEKSLHDFDTEQEANEASHKCPDCCGLGYVRCDLRECFIPWHNTKCETCNRSGYVD